MAQSFRKTAIRFGLEASYGVDAAPTAGILAGDITINPLEGNSVQRNVMMPHFGKLGSIRTENYVKLSFSCELAGSGAAGTAPLWGPLLRACNFTETVTAAPVTGTAQAGGSTTSIRLAAGASAIDDFYVGMTVAITGGTGNGQSGEIVGYVGSTRVATIARAWSVAPDATSLYSIAANVLYTPNSHYDGTTNTSATLYFNKDGIQHVLLGARGNVKPDISSGSIPSLAFEFTGLMGAVTDQTFPTLNLSAWQVPLTVSTANTPLLTLHNFSALVWEKLSLDMGNDVQYSQRVNGEAVRISDRTVTGSLSAEMEAIATKDFIAAAKANAYGVFAVRHGVTAGNIITIVGPNVQVQFKGYEDSAGTLMQSIDLAFAPKVSNDELRICVR